MSLFPTFESYFTSLNGIQWKIQIFTDTNIGNPIEIKLEGDEPCVIDWPETNKNDVIQSSICRLRVSNENDRQMIMLMDHPASMIEVHYNPGDFYRIYWVGMLDDAIYEEPYSYKKDYVTEIIFSDFGKLKRVPFTLTGKQSLGAIVGDCLSTVFGVGHYRLLTTLCDEKTGLPISLDDLYIDADRLKEDGQEEQASKYDVLEEILRPLGLRIMRKGGVTIYDMEYLRENKEFNSPITWKGTDAFIKGSETFGRFSIVYDQSVKDVLAVDGLEYDSKQWTNSKRHYTYCYNSVTENDDLVGFYVETLGSLNDSKLQISNLAKIFRLRSVFSDGSDIGIAWRIKCWRAWGYLTTPEGLEMPLGKEIDLVNNQTAYMNSNEVNVFKMETGYLPVVPDGDKFQLRISLDFLLSFRPNPFDAPPDEWGQEQAYYNREFYWTASCPDGRIYMIPVKLEVLSTDGSVLYHYENSSMVHYSNPDFDLPRPFGINKGRWVAGAGSYGQMFLAYYLDTDEDPLINKGWVTNRIASHSKRDIKGTIYIRREDGEYVSMPPVAGRIRFTVSNGVYEQDGVLHTVSFAEYKEMIKNWVRWQLYKNPKITLVKANQRDDVVNKDSIDVIENPEPMGDSLSETLKVCTWGKGVAPSARGLLFNSQGYVIQKFHKNISTEMLNRIRLHSLEDQLYFTQPKITGTAELDISFCAKTDASTSGVFLVVGLRQDLQEGTEEVVMERIAGLFGFVYAFSWSDPICVQEQERYDYEWSDPVCVGVYKNDETE